jgi:hypothetical protein
VLINVLINFLYKRYERIVKTFTGFEESYFMKRGRHAEQLMNYFQDEDEKEELFGYLN